MKIVRGQIGQPVLGNLVSALIALVVFSACSTISGEAKVSGGPGAVVSEMGSCSLGLTEAITDEEAIRALLHAEGAYVVQQDIGSLMHLWKQDGRICDAKHTPANLADDQTWQDADAIHHRYTHWVFPGDPRVAEPLDLVISITGERAVVTGTTRIGDEISPAGDRWRLVKEEECWMLQELVFNLEPR